tara:strand:- start:363 stop:482 length:120 start_codon:yes stop_codon:yes gene_type:complete
MEAEGQNQYVKTDEKYKNIEGGERSPSGRKTSLQVFKEL